MRHLWPEAITLFRFYGDVVNEFLTVGKRFAFLYIWIAKFTEAKIQVISDRVTFGRFRAMSMP